MKAVLYFFLIIGCSFIEAGTVRLLNDSTFVLSAEIKAADGTSLGTMTLTPQQAMTWDDYTGGVTAYSHSRTPFTVIWYCPEGEIFGVTSQLSSGSVTAALASTGERACKLPSKKENNNTPNNNQSYSPAAPESSGDRLLKEDQRKEDQQEGPPEGFFN